MIKVLFFAQLREQLGCGEIAVNERDIETIVQLREYLVLQHPQWAIFLNNQKLLVAVNQTLVKASQHLHAGDEIAFFPPVTGG